MTEEGADAVEGCRTGKDGELNFIMSDRCSLFLRHEMVHAVRLNYMGG
jgi:hypothetical protein